MNEDKDEIKGLDTASIDAVVEKMKSSRKKKKILTAVLAVIFAMGIMLGAGAIYVRERVDKNADPELYRSFAREMTTRFYYYDRESDAGIENAKEIENSAIYAQEKHIFAPYDTIPEHLINAFVAIEDKRFYAHDGVDWYRTAGAGLNYVLKFRDSFGASTITQQLVKNVTGNDDYSVERKIQEIFYALSLEEKIEKNEILELYLNVINMSQGCKGVRSAAMTYFSKELYELTLLECACLAAITNSPSYYDPYINPENNKKRRQIILSQMLAEGFISKSEFDECYYADVVLNMNEEYRSEKVNSWYIDMVISDVCDDLCDKYGYSYAEASELVYSGGLRIYTLMDVEVQRIVEKYYADESNFTDSGSGLRAQTSMIIIDPYTGDVLGVAGARGVKNANRIQNYATETLRPSGSVIKPLSIYAPALEDGLITYASVFDDVPVNFGKYNMDASKGEIVYPSPWPNNAPTVYHGLVNVNYAVEVSLNTVPVKILDLIGKERSFSFLKDELGFYNLIESLTLEDGTVLTDMDTASLALGQMNYGVTVREVTAGYSIFANEGIYSEPRSYSLVTDSFGEVILDNERRSRQVISAETAYIMNQMLMNVVDFGTAEGISLDSYTSVAGKTGTSQAYYDRWFIGYTPRYVGGVWYGYEYPKPLENNTKHICTEIWDDVMSEIYRTRGHEYGEKFSGSDRIVRAEYCRDSGKLMTVACRADPRGDRSEIGYFVSGSEPTEKCDCHTLVKYDKTNGGVAYGTCPVSDVTYVGLICVERHFPIQVYVSDAQYVYRELPRDVMPGDDDDEPFFINTLDKGDFCGVSYTAVQYNRACRAHFNYLEWLLGRQKKE